ncbi:ABC transporter permease [Xanthobacter flavus]|uniref:ABC transporter permease n=1 Tax=Xanthobacter flavus TaxID=281 RepID=UPI00372B78D5
MIALFALWQTLVNLGVLPELLFGRPTKIAESLFNLFYTGKIYPHLLVTLIETLLAFVIGTGFGLIFGLWLGLNETAARVLDPYLKAANAMPRVVLAPIFTVWFGLTIWSKVALGVTLVFFIVFFSVYNGVRDANRNVLASTRMMGASHAQLIRYFYLPSAMSWVFASLHASVGMAFVGAVVGEYLGSARGVGYLILQAEAVFDISTVFAGIIILTIFALVLDAAVTILEKRVMKWRPT